MSIASWFQGIPVGVYIMVGLLFVLYMWDGIAAIRRFEWFKNAIVDELAQARVEIEKLQGQLSSEREAREELEYRLTGKSPPPFNF